MTPASKALDQYFTPTKLASELIAAVTLDSPSRVGDFAAGDGELLRAAILRWPKIECIATDIDSQVVSQLKENHGQWLSSCCNFMDIDCRTSSLVLQDLIGTMPLIVLNPPFSSKGKTLQWIEVEGERTRCTPALAFIVEAAKYLQKGGQLLAIVPLGLTHSTKDGEARRLLELYYGFEVVKTYDKGGFVKCSPRTAIIRLTAGQHSLVINNHQAINNGMRHESQGAKVSVQRGRVPNNHIKDTGKGRLPFIHTTNLSKNSITNINRRVNEYRDFTGPGVLLPRVGRPKIEKIALITHRQKFVLSECVFIIECKTLEQASTLYHDLLTNWDIFKSYYGGTCASFITTQSLSLFLNNCGYQVCKIGQSIRDTDLIEVSLFSSPSIDREKVAQKSTHHCEVNSINIATELCLLSN